MSEALSVSVAIEGGLGAFPGLAQPFTVRAADLPPEEADRLAKLVAESGFFEIPEGRGQGGPDSRTYTVTVDLGGRRRTLTVPDPPPNAALRELITIVERHRRAG